jgi:hypothetical protein
VLAIFSFAAPAKDLSWRVGNPVRPTAILWCINQRADVAVAHQLARRFVRPYVEIVPLLVNVKKLLSDDVAGIF